MKFGKRELLKKLVSKEIPNRDEEPLSNIKNAMGSVSHVIGNPLFKAEIAISVRVVYQNGAGVILLPGALPANEQMPVPFYLFGLTDFYSSFPTIRNSIPPFPIWTWLGTFIYVNFAAVMVAIGAVNGDLISQYVDWGTGNICWVIVHCNNVAYGTFLNSFVSDLITVDQIRYIVPAAFPNQFINSLTFSYQTLFGKVKSDTVDPRMYKFPTDPQVNICDIPVKFPIDKNLMIGSYLDFGCQLVNFIFFVSHVKPLTFHN